jgi:RND superfamily putative drug exporter
VSLFGKWNWYLPDWTAKLLRIEPSHARLSPQERLPEEPGVPAGT